MNERLTQIYNLEKQYIQSKQILQRNITQEIQMTQSLKSYDFSLDALKESDKKVFIPFGRAFLLRYYPSILFCKIWRLYALMIE